LAVWRNLLPYSEGCSPAARLDERPLVISSDSIMKSWWVALQGQGKK